MSPSMCSDRTVPVDKITEAHGRRITIQQKGASEQWSAPLVPPPSNGICGRSQSIHESLAGMKAGAQRDASGISRRRAARRLGAATAPNAFLPHGEFMAAQRVRLWIARTLRWADVDLTRAPSLSAPRLLE